MLLELTIENMALVHELRASFGEGLTIFSGETGAGKSILVGALTVLMGSRAEKETIAHNAEKAVVEGVFDVGDARAREQLAEIGIELREGDTLSVYREWSRTGRGICRLNGRSFPVSALRELHLIDIFGQQDYQFLRSHAAQRDILDAYGVCDALRAAMKESYAAWRAAKKAASALDMDEAERARRIDMLRFQIDEIESAELDAEEEEALLAQRAMMRNARRLRENIAKSHYILNETPDMEGACALDMLRDAARLLQGFDDIPELGHLHERLEEALYQVEDVDSAMTDYLENLDFDEETAARVEDRLALIAGLKRKYGASVEDVLEYGDSIRAEYDHLAGYDARLAEHRAREEKTRAEMARTAGKLRDARRAAGQDFAKAMLHQLKDLGMEKTRFEVRIEESETYSSAGADDIGFYISPNPGLPLSPLEKTASGGEMSRLMLALKNVTTAEQQDVCMVFDEIDTGVSGHMAQAVAEKLARIARGKQVLCVTHLQQLASMGDAHYLVQKRSGAEDTYTEVLPLAGRARVEELTRLVGGSGETAYSHAEALLREAEDFRRSLGE